MLHGGSVAEQFSSKVTHLILWQPEDSLSSPAAAAAGSVGAAGPTTQLDASRSDVSTAGGVVEGSGGGSGGAAAAGAAGGRVGERRLIDISPADLVICLGSMLHHAYDETSSSAAVSKVAAGAAAAAAAGGDDDDEDVITQIAAGKFRSSAAVAALIRRQHGYVAGGAAADGDDDDGRGDDSSHLVLSPEALRAARQLRRRLARDQVHVVTAEWLRDSIAGQYQQQEGGVGSGVRRKGEDGYTPKILKLSNRPGAATSATAATAAAAPGSTSLAGGASPLPAAAAAGGGGGGGTPPAGLAVGGMLSQAVLSWPWEVLGLATSTGGSDSDTAAGACSKCEPGSLSGLGSLLK